MVFAKTASTVDIWSLPLDANEGTVRGPPVRVTHDLADDLAGPQVAFKAGVAGQAEFAAHGTANLR